jgi:phage repressor protein C with HTH and peptisase S24 domain
MNEINIKELRKKLRVSQEKLAELLGVHHRTVQNYETGGVVPKAKYALLCKLMEKVDAQQDGDLSQDEPILREPIYYGSEDFEMPTYVPLLPISAQGGSLNDFIVSVKDSDCERIISPIKGADFAMTVAGDSMSPEYPSGSQILVKKINEKAFIDWGKVYVLDTCNGSVIKRIFPADDKDASKVKCVSINPDYPPFEVSLEDVYGVYRVLLSMSVK